MNLDSALSIAAGGLANLNRQFAVVSQNVANAGTAGYAREISTQTSVAANGVGMGVRTGLVTRAINTALQSGLTAQNATVSALSTRQTALQAVDTALGSTGSGSDLASLLGSMQDAFSTLQSDPSNQTQQSAVVQSAATLANGINQLATTYTQQRQAAQSAIAADVTTLNTTLATIGSLSDQVIRLRAAGQSTADVENQRDAAVGTLSSLLSVKVMTQANGDLTVMTASGTLLPTRSQTGPLTATDSTIGPEATYPGGGIAGITLGGADVTTQLTGGSIGANIILRDSTLPTDQAELDGFAQTLASRFDAQGLRLFADPAGAVPTGDGTPAQSGYVGFASTIQVNPAVQTTPTLVRDGTQAVAGSTTGASAFTPNTASGPAGFDDLINRVLTYALGTQVQDGVAQPASPTSGLGATGTLIAPYSGATDLASIAASLVAAQSQDSATATDQLTTEQGVQTSLQSKISAQSGVSVDTEMSNMVALQNAYGANAKIISSVQTLWNELLGMVQ